MSEKLSQEQIDRALDAGNRTFRRSRNLQIEKIFPLVDFEKILSGSNAKKIIQSLPPQVLYHAILKRGPQDCLEILPLLTSEQFIRLCDYDIWHKDRLIPHAAFRWLNLYKEISPKQMYQRFRQLDEEYQLALLSPYCRFFTKDDFEKMSDEQQDALYHFPNDALYYSINSDDELIHSSITGLVDASMAQDMNFAISLITHASYSLCNESEQLILQFRNARLEEDGFVTYEESLECFQPCNPTSFFKDNKFEKALSRLDSNGSKTSYLNEVMQYGPKNLWTPEQTAHIHTAFLYLANSVCSATHIESDDSNGLKDLLEQTSSLVSFSLDTLNQGDVSQGAQMLLNLYPKKLFQIGLGIVELLRETIIDSLQQLAISEKALHKLRNSWKTLKFGRTLTTLDTYFLPILGHEHTEELKGIFNRFPLLASRVTKKEGVDYISFKPIENFQEFVQMVKKSEIIINKIQLANAANIQTKLTQSLDKVLYQGLLGILVRGEFNHTSSPDNDIKEFMNSSLVVDEQLILSQVKDYLLSQHSVAWSENNFVSQTIINKNIYSEALLNDLLDLLHRLYAAKKDAQHDTLLTLVTEDLRTSNIDL